MGPPRVSNVRNLLEKVEDLRGINHYKLVQSNLEFLSSIDLCLQSQTVSDYHPLFLILGLYICFLKIKELFLDAYVVGPVFPKRFDVIFWGRPQKNLGVFFFTKKR